MMGEEIGVDRYSDDRRHPVRWMMPDPKVEQTPRLDDVAADGGIHEPREKRHPKHFGVGEVGIAPRLDAARRLEHLERKADEVEQRDGLHLVPALELGPQHASLDQESDEQEKVIARNAEQATARDGEDRGEEEAGEQAGAYLLDPKCAKLGQRPAKPRQVGPGAELQKLIVERTHETELNYEP